MDIVIVLAVLTGAFYVMGRTFGEEGHESGVLGALGFAFVGSIVTGMVWGVVFFAQVGTVAEQEAFYRTTLDAYEYTVEKTESIIIEVPGTVPATVVGTTIEIPVAQQGQAVAVSERLAELRNRVEQFNASLASNRAYNAIFFVEDFVPAFDDDIRPITIEVV